jgi:hypothetical protein
MRNLLFIILIAVSFLPSYDFNPLIDRKVKEKQELAFRYFEKGTFNWESYFKNCSIDFVGKSGDYCTQIYKREQRVWFKDALEMLSKKL